MTDTVGMNLTQMAALQQAFEARAAEVERLVAELGGLVGTGGGPGAVHWVGRVADQFRAEWDGTYVPNLRRLSEALREQARWVGEQRRRSNLVLNGIDA